MGESQRIGGRGTSHRKSARQFAVHCYTTVLPATTARHQRYLGSGLIKGIDPVMAERMGGHFGWTSCRARQDHGVDADEPPDVGPWQGRYRFDPRAIVPRYEDDPPAP